MELRLGCEALAASHKEPAFCAESLKTVRDWIGTATRTKVFEEASSASPIERKQSRALSSEETRELLKSFNLDQRYDGDLYRCPSRRVYEFENDAGEKLGAIGECFGHLRFDAPDGTFGGIRPKK
jgi:hypothetical protein